MARPEHPKKKEGVVLLLAGRSPREVSDGLGVPIETVRTWSKGLGKPGALAKVAHEISPSEPEEVEHLLETLFKQKLKTLIAIERHVSGEQEIKYLNRQNIADVSQYSYASTQQTMKLGDMRERMHEELKAEDAIDVEGREIE